LYKIPQQFKSKKLVCRKTRFSTFMFVTIFIIAMMVFATNNVCAEDRDVPGWFFYMDNDLFITPNLDRDYTAGMSVAFSGAGSAHHLLSIDSALGVIDSWSGLNNTSDFVTHSFEFGITGFTPDKIQTRAALQNDRPYASLVYIANNRQYINISDKRSLISTLSVGLLGMSIAGNLQNGVHNVIDLDESLGWDNQISSDDELTFRYGLSRQAVRWHDYSTADKYEIKTALRGSIGFITDVTWSISGRWGDIRSPWWTFNPQLSGYTEKSAPSFPVSSTVISGGVGEFYYWAGLSIHLRAYNVFLQGQFRDSVVTYRRDELNRFILEAWFGVTAEIFDGLRVSYVVRGQTPEVRRGEGARNPIWGGVIVSQAF